MTFTTLGGTPLGGVANTGIPGGTPQAAYLGDTSFLQPALGAIKPTSAPAPAPAPAPVEQTAPLLTSLSTSSATGPAPSPTFSGTLSSSQQSLFDTNQAGFFLSFPELWDEQAYLDANPDIAANWPSSGTWNTAWGPAGLTHFIRHGWAENRSGFVTSPDNLNTNIYSLSTDDKSELFNAQGFDLGLFDVFNPEGDRVSGPAGPEGDPNREFLQSLVNSGFDLASLGFGEAVDATATGGLSVSDLMTAFGIDPNATQPAPSSALSSILADPTGVGTDLQALQQGQPSGETVLGDILGGTLPGGGDIPGFPAPSQLPPGQFASTGAVIPYPGDYSQYAFGPEHDFFAQASLSGGGTVTPPLDPDDTRASLGNAAAIVGLGGGGGSASGVAIDQTAGAIANQIQQGLPGFGFDGASIDTGFIDASGQFSLGSFLDNELRGTFIGDLLGIGSEFFGADSPLLDMGIPGSINLGEAGDNLLGLVSLVAPGPIGLVASVVKGLKGIYNTSELRGGLQDLFAAGISSAPPPEGVSAFLQYVGAAFGLNSYGSGRIEGVANFAQSNDITISDYGALADVFSKGVTDPAVKSELAKLFVVASDNLPGADLASNPKVRSYIDDNLTTQEQNATRLEYGVGFAPTQDQLIPVGDTQTDITGTMPWLDTSAIDTLANMPLEGFDPITGLTLNPPGSATPVDIQPLPPPTLPPIIPPPVNIQPLPPPISFPSGGWFSSRKFKEHRQAVDGQEVLEKLRGLTVERWNYRGDLADGRRHLGPMAEDFHEAFGVGDGVQIMPQDAFGVALAAIKALSQQAADLQRQLHEVRRDVEVGYSLRGALDGP